MLLHHLLDNETIQWLASYSQYSLNNEQRLALVFVREVGAIDNMTYRQLNSDINNQKASYDLHDLCSQGLIEQKGQSRSTYYIAGEKFVNSRGIDTLNSRDCSLNSRDSSLNSRDARENSIGNGENSNAIRENSNATGENGNANSPFNSRGGSLNSRAADALNSRAITLPKDIEEKLAKIGKRSKPEAMKELIIELCDLGPMSLQELANILKRKPSSLRYLYVNSLIDEHKLFHTIPEMLNHPDQKYTTVKNK